MSKISSVLPGAISSESYWFNAIWSNQKGSDWSNGSTCNAVMSQIVSDLLRAISNESYWLNVA